jgi:glycosyltransferase involved in cell wall biosynthesis
MRILLVQATDWIRRNPAQQHHLMEILSLRGHSILVIDFEILWRENKGSLLSRRKVFKNVQKIYDGIRLTVVRPSFIRFPLLDYFSILYMQSKEIERQIKHFRPDVVVAIGIAAYIAGKISKKYCLPFVYYWIDVSHRLIPFKFLQPIGWFMERKALEAADIIFVINKKLKEYVIKMGADPQKTITLGAGIDFKKFYPSIDGTIIRKQYGIHDEDLVLFFMGWLYKFSGLREVALQLCKSGYEKIKLLIVGDGDLYNELHKIRNENRLQGRILLVGKKPYSEIPVFIAASDICLLPAYPTEKIMHDIVPIKMYEYMAMGKPVIATKLEGIIKEFGENNGVIYVDKPQDVILKAIELHRAKKVKDFGLMALNFVKKYSWVNVSNEFERVLKDLLHNKR